MIATSASFQFFLWSLVCFSSREGAPVMAALPILLASYHSQFFQLSFKYPYGALATISGVTAALFLVSHSNQLAILLLGGGIALATGWVMGDIERRGATLKREHGALKAAVDAQLLLEQSREIMETKDLINEIRGTNHDANNALSGVLFNLQYLLNKTKKMADVSDILLIQELASDISLSVENLKRILEKGRDIGKGNRSLEKVNVNQVVNRVLQLAQQKFPKTNVTVHWKNAPHSNTIYFINLLGGETTLERIITNLLFNACEGNGQIAASNVQLKINNENPNFVDLTIEDDGPGFGAEEIESLGSKFKTTKHQGTGLGLYTTQRLVQANNGGLEFANRDIVGAYVQILLPTSSGSAKNIEAFHNHEQC